MDLIRANQAIENVVKRMENVLSKVNNQSAMGQTSVDPKFGSRSFTITINPDTFDLSLIDRKEWQLLVDDFNNLREQEKTLLKDLYGENQTNKGLAGHGGYDMPMDYYQDGFI